MNLPVSRYKGLVVIGLIALFLASCGKSADEVPVDEISLDADISRFDLKQKEAAHQFEANPSASPLSVYQATLGKDKDYILDLLELRRDTLIPDTAFASFFADILRQPSFLHLLDTVAIAFPENSGMEKQLLNALKRLHYYFPEQEIPKVRTFVSGYRPTLNEYPMGIDNVMFSEKYLGIGLHFFLGTHYPYYPADLPMFIRRRCTPLHVYSVTFSELGERLLPRRSLGKQPVLVEEMVRAGIKLVFLDKMLPDTPDSLKIFYTPGQMAWAEENEKQIYKMMVDDLYSTNVKIYRNYIDESPFTASLSRESPPRLGHFIGWKIVRKYLEKNPEVNLGELMKNENYQQIFLDSKYRPEE